MELKSRSNGCVKLEFSMIVTQFIGVKGTPWQLISGFIKMILIVCYLTPQFDSCHLYYAGILSSTKKIIIST